MHIYCQCYINKLCPFWCAHAFRVLKSLFLYHSYLDVSEALAQMRNCQAKLEDSERENTALTQSLQQKEAEITKLQEIIRYGEVRYRQI